MGRLCLRFQRQIRLKRKNKPTKTKTTPQTRTPVVPKLEKTQAITKKITPMHATTKHPKDKKRKGKDFNDLSEYRVVVLDTLRKSR
jgi:hypothetical protein